MTNQEHEEELTGGNVSKVYRVADTVRRELHSASPRIHKLLQHLEDKGFYYAPKFLGIDEKGREILSFIEGEAGNYPVREYMWSNETLTKIAKMLRFYHDSVKDFPVDPSWEPIDLTPEPLEVICHNDFAIYNIIFDKEMPVGIIDYDVAEPGPRIWDISYTLYTCVPLSRFYLSKTGEPIPYDPVKHEGRIKQRIALFLESYGTEITSNVLDMVLLRLEGLCKTIARRAKQGEVAFQKMIDEGHLEHYESDIRFIHEHRRAWV
ncbi:aminoglycoside phosphotransferase family protein [Paenibacillus sp. An7]|uniref:aminoglycoside phosphotransferase family protein n=1 Tax=Paenibacillus sp. An7 TaxID=2689577 RepID=UPI00135BEAE4|nr:aminoglycoside phosphotransferase family protein [Paenibacillus sp. An7]